jgi:2-polyprenyl-3-methyl-5-hydroxy-6-metoxy-1,4-benzoquinol methylase
MPKLLWNLYAHCYDAITGLGPYEDMLDEVVAALDLAPGMRVLDAGCGTGALASRVADRFPTVELVGVDLSTAMLKRARGRRRWPASFTFVEGTIDEVLSKTTAPFDRIASVNVIWTLSDPQRTFAAMASALRPDGRMVHTTPRWRFSPHAILWSHLRRRRGWNLVRALLGLPWLALAGLLNLGLVVQSMLLARAPNAGKRWHADGLVRLLGEAGTPTHTVRPCYAGQGHLLVCARENTPTDATRLPAPGNRL